MNNTIVKSCFSKALALLPCIIFYNSVKAQVQSIDSLKESAAIIAIEQQLMDAIPAGNMRAWEEHLDSVFFIVTENGSRLSRTEFLQTIKPLPKGYSGWIKVIWPKVVFKENTAVINYVSDEYEFVFGQKIHTTYSSMNTYLKRDNGWKMISSMVFEVPQLPPPIRLSAVILKKYIGTYYLQDTISCVISLSNDSLYIKKKGREKESLIPETENVFFRQADTRGRKLFVTNDFGGMIMLERRNGQDVTWRRK